MVWVSKVLPCFRKSLYDQTHYVKLHLSMPYCDLSCVCFINIFVFIFGVFFSDGESDHKVLFS